MKIDDQLYEMEKISNRKGDFRAAWIPDAVRWYIFSGRAPWDFEKAFLNLPTKTLSKLMTYCLKYDLSTEGIIKSIKRFLSHNKA